MSSAIDLEARADAARALERSETAIKRADQAVQIARSANDTSTTLAQAVDRGFVMLEGKVDALIDDVRKVKSDSMRPKLDSTTSKVVQLEADLFNERQQSGERLKALEAAEKARDDFQREAIARGKKLFWTGVLAFVGAVGAGAGAWTVSEARHVADRAHPVQTVPLEKTP